MTEQFKNFSERVYKTECARFEAYRRMKRRKLSSTVSLVILSLSIIVFNILQLCEQYEKYNEAITAVTIMLSVLVLALSLLVSYVNYSEKEHKYYECGLKLSRLCDKIDLVLSDSTHSNLNNMYLAGLKAEYQSILAECGVNHISIDYSRGLQRIDKKNGHNADWLKTTELWLQWNIFDVNFLYWILAFGIPLIAGLLIFNSSLFSEPIPVCQLYKSTSYIITDHR